MANGASVSTGALVGIGVGSSFGCSVGTGVVVEIISRSLILKLFTIPSAL